MKARVDEGSELAVESKRASVNLASTRQRFKSGDGRLEYARMLLAVTIGYPASDRVESGPGRKSCRPRIAIRRRVRGFGAEAEPPVAAFSIHRPGEELEIRSQNAQRLPQVVQWHNTPCSGNITTRTTSRSSKPSTPVRVSITIPLLVGSAAKALADQAATDIAKLRLQMNDTRKFRSQ